MGFATNCDAAHVTQPQQETMQLCMALALADAGLEPKDIGYISAHGTATERGDIAESHATAALFGDRTPISSLSRAISAIPLACGAIEAWLSLEMMAEGWFAPTLNLNEPDPACAPGPCPQRWSDAGWEYLMSNNFAFGGINTSLIFKRWA